MQIPMPNRRWDERSRYFVGRAILRAFSYPLYADRFVGRCRCRSGQPRFATADFLIVPLREEKYA
jgi:hypothetical protein